MSNFQYVFGNPIAGKKKTKKKLAKVKNKHKLDNKRNPMAKKKKSSSGRTKAQISATRRLVAFNKARKASNPHRRKKAKKSRNPAYVGYAKVKNKKTGHMELKRKAVSSVFAGRAERAELLKTISQASKAKGSPTAVKIANQAKKMLAKLEATGARAYKDHIKMKKAGMHIVTVGADESVADTVKRLKKLNKGAKVAKKKKTSKKKTGKKKSSGKKRSAKQRANDKKLGSMNKKRHGKKKKSKGKKKSTRKKSTYKKSTRKKSIRRKSSKKRTTKRKSSARKSYKFTVKRIRRLKKGKTIRLHVGKKSKKQKRYSITRTNPIGGIMGKDKPKSKVENLTGHTIRDISSLGIGGLAYGTVNVLMAKLPIVNKVQEKLANVAVIGPALPTLVIGAAITLLSRRIKNDALSTGLEMLGSGLVGASVVGMGVNAAQIFLPKSLTSPALSGINYTMNGVQYSPSMNGVDFTMGGQLGNSADFGAVGDADFGGVPSGMGYDVMDDDSDENSEDFEGVPSGMN